MPDKKLTNHDRIRNMSVEEMAHYFAWRSKSCPPEQIGACMDNHLTCYKCYKEWLESEVDNNE